MPRPRLVDRETGRFRVPVVVDTREQLPFEFRDIARDAADGGGRLVVETVRGTLASGDYSLRGYESRVAVERKSLADLFGTLGQGRERFEREVERLAGYEFAAVVVEGDWRAALGAYPPALVALRQAVAGRLLAGDRSHPWGDWLDTLDAAMPGPPPRSRLAPKTVWRTAVAWMVRYGVHWVPCPDRRFAEVATFRLLERFLKEDLARAQTTDADRDRGPGE